MLVRAGGRVANCRQHPLLVHAPHRVLDPLSPPIQPQLARPAKELPTGDGWRFEPKWDGFRTIVFREGDDVYLQSRNGKPMNRYFPEVVEQVQTLPCDRVVLDGELIVVVD